MGIPLTPAEITTPDGEISIKFFPGMKAEEFPAAVAGILKRSKARADRDELEGEESALIAAAYADGYRLAVSYHATRPSQFQLPDQAVQVSHSGEQLKALERAAAYWEGEYKAILEQYKTNQVIVQTRESETRALKNTYDWS